MALIVIFHNDSTGTDTSANYNVRVLVGDGTAAKSHTIAIERVEGHNRADGWRVLLDKLVHQSSKPPSDT